MEPSAAGGASTGVARAALFALALQVALQQDPWHRDGASWIDYAGLLSLRAVQPQVLVQIQFRVFLQQNEIAAWRHHEDYRLQTRAGRLVVAVACRSAPPLRLR